MYSVFVLWSMCRNWPTYRTVSSRSKRKLLALISDEESKQTPPKWDLVPIPSNASKASAQIS